VVFALMGEERVIFVAIQWMSWTRVLFRGTSRSTIRRMQVPGPRSSAHHTGEEMVGRVAVSGGEVLVAVFLQSGGGWDGTKHTWSGNQLSPWRDCVVAICDCEVLRDADRKARCCFRRRARKQQCADT
jgi:hypothetical protein